MKAILRSLFVPRDWLSGKTYLAYGLGLFACKYVLDFLLARYGLGFSWWPTDYFWPRARRPYLGQEMSEFSAMLMLALAIPFIWAGVNLTARRLRSLGWPVFLVCLFFAPYLNFIFFALLAFKTRMNLLA